jgi:hypothetical protein
MKKLAVLLVFLTVLLFSISAYAFVLPVGDWNAHYSGFFAIYHNGVAQSASYTPVQGDYLKLVLDLEQVIPKGGGPPAWFPTPTEQIAGYEYGFEFLGSIPAGADSVKYYWGPVTVTQSRIDLYQRNSFVWNTGPSFAPQTGPVAVDGGPGHPSAIVAGIDDVGSSLFLGMHILLHPDQSFPGATLVITTNVQTLTASGDFYADIDSGLYAGSIKHQNLGPAQIPSDMYLKFSSNTNPPLYG